MSEQKPWSMFDEPAADGAPPLPAHLQTHTPKHTTPTAVAQGMGVFRWTLTIRATTFESAQAFEETLKRGFFGRDKGHKHVPLWVQTYEAVPRRLGTRIVVWTQSTSKLDNFTCEYIVLYSGEQVAALPDVTEHMHGRIEHNVGTITCQRSSTEQYVETFSVDHS